MFDNVNILILCLTLLQDLRNQKGIYHYPNGDKYVGEWKDDRFHGHGIYLFANGERYEGTLFEGAKHGQGVYHYVNGNKYTGAWKGDKKCGHGVYTYACKSFLILFLFEQ